MKEWFEEGQHDLSWADFQANLKKLPQGLDGCYRKTFEKLIGFVGDIAKDFLLFMVGCREPLSETSVKDVRDGIADDLNYLWKAVPSDLLLL